MSAPRPSALPERFGPEEFAAASGVSRETLARLKAYVGLLEDWNTRHNLVSTASLAQVWRRHVWDSAQLARFVPRTAKTLVDLGSGAGFPGLVLAEMLRDTARVTLIEATAKKCRFLEEVGRRLGLEIVVRNERAEEPGHEPFDIVTARACAPLDRLFLYAQHFVGPRTVCLFLKGQSVGVELTQARKSWNIRALQHPSLSDPSGAILEVRELTDVRSQTPARPGRRQPKGRRR